MGGLHTDPYFYGFCRRAHSHRRLKLRLKIARCVVGKKHISYQVSCDLSEDNIYLQVRVLLFSV